MGSDKALLYLRGKPFIEHISDVLLQVFEKVIIISDRLDDYGFVGVPIYADIYKNCGPLGGIHSALTNAGTDKVFIVSCDMPLISKEIIRFIIDKETDSDVTVLSSRGKIQPLCGLYNRRCLGKLEEHLQWGQRSVRRFLKDVNTIVVAPSGSSDQRVNELTNVNTPKVYIMIVNKLHSGV